ncbi:MAG: hypothetical protein ACI84F_003899 [Pseudoalteromonas tetraodonis]
MYLLINPNIIFISYQLSAISYQLSAISYQLSAISYQLSAISYQLSARLLYTNLLIFLSILQYSASYLCMNYQESNLTLKKEALR